jgi:CHU_C Type IX secretion signal domain/PKD domain
MIFKKSVWVCLLTLSGLWFPAMADPGLKFIKNKTQWPKQIDFMAKIPGGNFSLQAGSFRYSFLDQRKIEELHDQSHGKNKEIDSQHELNQQIDGQIIQSTFIGSNIHSVPQPFGELPEYYNYFLGNDSLRWSSNVRAYEGVIYPNFYEGINLKVYSQGQNLKYDFVVAPGAAISTIRFEYKGAEELYLKNGDLIVHTALADMIEKKPLLYQIIDGRKIYIKGSYELIRQQISFCVEEYYDPCYELVIDPLLIFSTYSGFTADNWGSTATPGERGTLYSAGVTNLNNGGVFRFTPGAFQTLYGGEYDVAIFKYDSTGSQLLYASFLGGSQSESPHSLVMTANEELLILGTTSSSDFPVSNSALDKTYNGGVPVQNVITFALGSDIFVAKISKDGTQRLAATYLGGSQNDGLNPTSSPLVRNYGDQLRGDIISDASGNIFISSVTSSPNFPITNGFDMTYNGGLTDALMMKLNSDLSQISWATFLGGSAADASHTIQIDKNGDLFIGGGSNSPDFLMTSGAYQPMNAGGVDGWIAKVKGNGSSILNSTFTGTSLFNQVYFLDLDQQENVYVYGQTEGAFPITANVYNNPNSGQFLQKFDNSLSTRLFSTVFGSGIGIPNISPTAFLVNDCNNIYIAGWGGELNGLQGFWDSKTIGMAVTPDAYQSTTRGSDFYLMVLSGDANQLLYATFLGGSISRTHLDGGTCRFDKGGVVYHAVCAGCSNNSTGLPQSDFPSTPKAWSRVNGSRNCNNAAFKFDLATLKAQIQSSASGQSDPRTVCLNNEIVFENKSIGGQTFYWDFGDKAKEVRFDRTDVKHKYALSGEYTVTLTVTDQSTCLKRDSAKIKVTVFIPEGFAGPDQVMCFDAGTTLIAGGGVDYQWKTADNSFKSNQPLPSVNPKEKTTYYVSITDINGCTKKDTLNVRVVPSIDLKFKADRVDYDCYNRPSVKVINQTDPAEEVFFDFGDGTTSDLPNVTHSYLKDGLFPVRLVGKKESCIYDEVINVPIFELKVPNVFTPEQTPGFNDTFVIEYGGQPISKSTLNVSLVIYNRWGAKVYENKKYRDEWTAGDVSAGIYYYETQIEGETNCKGWVQVIK